MTQPSPSMILKSLRTTNHQSIRFNTNKRQSTIHKLPTATLTVELNNQFSVRMSNMIKNLSPTEPNRRPTRQITERGAFNLASKDQKKGKRNSSLGVSSLRTRGLPTRRILRGRTVGDTRPYMVYLRPAAAADPKILETNWLCGGVIIHERYILTSAACIEDAKHFYVVSGLSTTSLLYVERKQNECAFGALIGWFIRTGQLESRTHTHYGYFKPYYFDGDDFDNIRWMVGDIAVVKVEDNFNFERRIRGCDFIPKKVDFNNRSADYEKARQVGTIAGWGTTERFGDKTNNVATKASHLLLHLERQAACCIHWLPATGGPGALVCYYNCVRMVDH
ncbi:hypothetical protein SFRURICE_016241 [Spodoptera frugiperda]|nr:hypothetical protein SFRURICE_016241 [Spodoptera frugiperda]